MSRDGRAPYPIDMPVQPYSPWMEQAAADPSEKRRILLADDDPPLVRLLEENLRIEGYEVMGVFDGPSVLRAAHETPYDLIILDVNMPMLNGLKVLDFLRTTQSTASIPIIFVTGELSKDVFPRISETPRVAFIKKPLDLESFNSFVRQFIEKYPRV